MLKIQSPELWMDFSVEFHVAIYYTLSTTVLSFPTGQFAASYFYSSVAADFDTAAWPVQLGLGVVGIIHAQWEKI